MLDEDDHKGMGQATCGQGRGGKKAGIFADDLIRDEFWVGVIPLSFFEGKGMVSTPFLNPQIFLTERAIDMTIMVQ